MLQTTRPTVVVPATSEPVNLAQAKKQLEIPSSDTAHDDHIDLLIQAAREQWEHDTDSASLTQTLRVYLDAFNDQFVYLPTRPIQSITSIKYYDSLNTLQTMPATDYTFDKSSREIRLAYLKLWPLTLARWDAIEITYLAGYGAVSAVPAIAKQAMLLLIGHYFENRDMIGNAMSEMVAYHNLVLRYQRASYP